MQFLWCLCKKPGGKGRKSKECGVPYRYVTTTKDEANAESVFLTKSSFFPQVGAYYFWVALNLLGRSLSNLLTVV
jgi:hypothetical protein